MALKRRPTRITKHIKAWKASEDKTDTTISWNQILKQTNTKLMRENK